MLKRGALGKLSEHLQQWRTRWCVIDLGVCYLNKTAEPACRCTIEGQAPRCLRVYLRDGGELRHTIPIENATLDIGDADTYEFKITTERAPTAPQPVPNSDSYAQCTPVPAMIQGRARSCVVETVPFRS
jgi:hypothetical protein